jgi:hypothetical protein
MKDRRCLFLLAVNLRITSGKGCAQCAAQIVSNNPQVGNEACLGRQAISSGALAVMLVHIG